MMQRRGMTLVEMLVALVIFVIVLAGALGALRSQTKGFNRGSDDLSLLQNMRFAADLLTQQIRTAGAGLAIDQPLLVYADTASIAYNADYVSNVPGDLQAVYVDPDVPGAEAAGLTVANQIVIPRSGPPFSYPVADYVGNQAETTIFFFEPDTSTPDATDYVLRRQVNDQAPEIVIRNVFPYPGRAFFRYFYRATTGGVDVLDTVPTAWYPLSHPDAQYTGTESGVPGRINRVRTVEVSYTVSNGLEEADRRTEAMSFMVSLPNAGLKTRPSCGAVPNLGAVNFVGAPGGTINARTVELTWAPAADELGGERDIMRYLIWRKRPTDPTWGDPYRSVPAGRTAYAFSDPLVSPGDVWQYRLAAQDCTPNTSVAVQATSDVTVPSP